MDEVPVLQFIEEPIYQHGAPPLRIGTDCSGIEAPIQALRQLGIPHQHVWSSDIDKYCIQSIKANYKPEIFFGDPEGPYPCGDIQKRDVNLLPDVDLYVCGFPCQPFSHAGERRGFKDRRGNVFWSCLEVIEVKQPKYFILENVKGLLHHDKGRTWKVIWDALSSLEGYNVQWKLLNTKDYGIPQNRERVYIVGTKEEFEWPEKVEMDDIKNYVDWEDTKHPREVPPYAQSFVKRMKKNALFINLSFRNFDHPYSHLYSYCIMASCARKMWVYPLSRYATCSELLFLQGFKHFKQVTSDAITKHQIGNSMSVNVVKCLLNKLLY